jgi:hypothetical protein
VVPDVYSPHIVAGWLPLMESEALESLEFWWNNDKNSKVVMSNTGSETREILWTAADISTDSSLSW